MPDDVWEPSIAVLAIAAFGFGVGFANAVVTVFWRWWEKAYAQLTRLLYFVSGIFYLPDAIGNLRASDRLASP